MDSSDYIPEEERVLYSNYFLFQGVDEEDSWVDSGDPTSLLLSPPTEDEMQISKPVLDLNPIIKDIEKNNPDFLTKEEIRDRLKLYVETMTTEIYFPLTKSYTLSTLKTPNMRLITCPHLFIMTLCQLFQIHV